MSASCGTIVIGTHTTFLLRRITPEPGNNGHLHVTAGADLEILHGRWLMGWLPIVNYTDACKGGGWLIMVDVSYTTLHKKKIVKGGWLATLSTPPGSAPALGGVQLAKQL